MVDHQLLEGGTQALGHFEKVLKWMRTELLAAARKFVGKVLTDIT